MQITTGIRAILSHPQVYDLFQNFMGAHKTRLDFANNDVRALAGQKLLDIGCGTARILDYLPRVQYIGFDMSEAYIAEAKSRYADRGDFHCALFDETAAERFAGQDIVLAIGLLHHLEDEQVRTLFRLLHTAMKPGARLITMDPCYADGQNPLARMLIDRDRGQNVRSPQQYSAMATGRFAKVGGLVKNRAWIPYTHWVMECEK